MMDLEPSGEPLGLGRREGLVERGWCVGIELIHDQDDCDGVPVAAVCQILDEGRPVPAAAVLGHSRRTPAGQRLERHEDIGGAVPDILAIVALDLTRPW
jgi:hypothetical protein